METGGIDRYRSGPVSMAARRSFASCRCRGRFRHRLMLRHRGLGPPSLVLSGFGAGAPRDVLDMRHMLFAPLAERRERDIERTPEICEGVLHPLRNLRMNLPTKESSGLHLAQLQCQHALADPWQRTSQLVEAQRPRPEA